MNDVQLYTLSFITNYTMMKIRMVQDLFFAVEDRGINMINFKNKTIFINKIKLLSCFKKYIYILFFSLQLLYMHTSLLGLPL